MVNLNTLSDLDLLAELDGGRFTATLANAIRNVAYQTSEIGARGRVTATITVDSEQIGRVVIEAVVKEAPPVRSPEGTAFLVEQGAMRRTGPLQGEFGPEVMAAAKRIADLGGRLEVREAAP